jgi:ABC-type phosphate transport system substrate-binding protein
VPETDTVLTRKRRVSLSNTALVGPKRLLFVAIVLAFSVVLLASCGGGGSSSGGGTTQNKGESTQPKATTTGPKTTITPGGATTKETTIQRTVPKQ